MAALVVPRGWDLVELQARDRSSGLTIRRLGDGFRRRTLPLRSARTERRASPLGFSA